MNLRFVQIFLHVYMVPRHHLEQLDKALQGFISSRDHLLLWKMAEIRCYFKYIRFDLSLLFFSSIDLIKIKL